MAQKRYVVVNAQGKPNEVLLVLKDRPDYLKGVLNLPGGKIEDEEPWQTAVRELEEETGLKAMERPEQTGVIYGSRSYIYCFNVKVGDQALRPREGETEVPAWHKLPEVYNHPALMPNLRLVLQLMRSSARGWAVRDWSGDWRKMAHTVTLILSGDHPYPLKVTVPGMASFVVGHN